MRDESSSNRLQNPLVQRRAVDPQLEMRARALGLSPVAARVLGGRRLASALAPEAWLTPSLDQLDGEGGFADIECAAERLAGAILSDEVIGIATDYDMDGLGAHAMFRLALVEMFGHPPERLRSYVGHRLTEGYGLTTALASRILEERPRPALLVSADCGSSDEERIARLAAVGIDVVVTDHHELPEDGPPRSAYACINPQRADCAYPDKAIAGGMVLWLLLRAVRQILCEVGHAPAQHARLEHLLDFVACSTVADCVSLAGHNNRAVVRAGLALMNACARPCWQVAAQRLRVPAFQAQTIAFGIAPRVNARSRLSDPFAALHFLLARDVRSAEAAFDVLDAENRARKDIEKAMLDEAVALAARQVAEGRYAITLVLPEGHPGVQGICSARLVERFGRPTFLFSPMHGDAAVLSGSARTVEGIHVQQLLREVHRRAPGLIQRFGGHKAAAGAQIRAADFPVFEALFEQVTQARVARELLGPRRWSDGALAADQTTLTLLNELDTLEPTGRGFEPALFDDVFEVLALHEIGDGTHLRLTLRQGERRRSAVWFRARSHRTDPLPVRTGERPRLLHGLMDNTYGGTRRLELRIEACVREADSALGNCVLPTPTPQAERLGRPSRCPSLRTRRRANGADTR